MDTNNFPSWTKRVVTNTTGRDPLGLSRVAYIITDFLLTGIITTTDRARYYSFFPWALSHVAREVNPTNYDSFINELQKREALLALSTLHVNPQSSPAPSGARTVRRRLPQYKNDGTVELSFRVLPSNSLGSYGQIYSSSLSQLGVIQRLESGIDIPMQPNGDKLASLFEASASSSPFLKDHLFKYDSLLWGKFEKTAPYFSLDNLSAANAKDECEALRLLFLGKTEEADTNTALRRDTILHVLYTIEQYEKRGFTPESSQVDWYLVYPTFYYNVLWPEDDKVITVSFPAQFNFIRILWRQFCTHQFLTIALERFMCAILDVVGLEPNGSKRTDIVSTLCRSGFTAKLKQIIGKDCVNPSKLLSALGLNCIPTQADSESIQKTITLLSPLSEISLVDTIGNNVDENAAIAIIMMSVLYAKWRGMASETGFAYVANHANEDLWVGNFLPLIDEWFSKDLSWEDVINKLVFDVILTQHDNIVYEKQRLDSSWFDRIEDRIVKIQDYEESFRASRHNNIVWIIRDLGLIDINDGAISITNDGRKILKEYLK